MDEVKMTEAELDAITEDDNETIPPGPSRYGDGCFVAVLANGSSVTVAADSMEIDPTGALIFRGGFRKRERAMPEAPTALIAFAAGQWRHAYAASCMTGEPVCVDAWSEPTAKRRAE